ncbi:hypothetical protein P7C73_g4949, partial [Tremellales sp. Uapishka_1]
MILPEDTKAPLSYSDDDLDLDISPPPSPSQPIRYFLADQDDDAYHTYPSSPRSASSLPLLEYASDIELGAPPPYSAKQEPVKRKSRRRRLLHAFAGAVLLYLLASGVTAVTRRMQGGPPRDKHNDRNPGENWADDGTAMECLAWSSQTPFAVFPSSEDAPALPTPLDPEVGYRRSTNSSFLLPTINPKTEPHDLFVHLFGVAAQGNIFVDTMADDEDGADGDNMRVTVESIYDVLPSVADDEATTVANSPGYEMLNASRICLMERPPNNTKGEHEAGRGVGIYTVRPTDTVHPHYPSTSPLQFRLHIRLPKSSPQTAAASLLDSLRPGPPPLAQPRGLIRNLEIRSGVSRFFANELKHVALGRLELSSAVGEMQFEDVRVEDLVVRTVGRIGGSIAVSNSLDVDAPV